MALNIQHVSEFSPDGKLFALINENGILKIWDTETNILKQEYTPNLHLSAPCTCLTWIVIAAYPQKSKKSKKEKESFEDDSSYQIYLALGTSKGIVTIYSYNLGKVERNLKGEGHSGKINSITYDNSNLLYTCGDDSKIICWNIEKAKRIASWNVGDEKPYSVICLPESKNILIGARQLKLYSSDSQELIQTYTGHTSEIILLTSFAYNSVEYALSASKMERIICLWTLNNKNKNRNASCTFLMEDLAHCLCCHIDEEGNLKVAAVTRSGVIHIYVNDISNIKTEKPIKPKVTIEITSDSENLIVPIPAATVSFKYGTTVKEILFGYGDKNFLQFEHIIPNFTEKVQVLIRDDPKKLYTKSVKKQKENILKTTTPIINENDVEYTSVAGFTRSKKGKDNVQIPMETRLQNLYLGSTEVSVSHAQSKVQLLIQALHSKDASLLLSVLTVNNPKVIDFTIQKLPIQYVGSLVNELTLLMQKKRANVKIASNWLKVLVKIHSSQLMALGADDLLNKFGPCLGVIEHRMKCLKDLAKLNGRLQLLVNQIRRNTDEDALNTENVLVYEDGDSSNSDLEYQNDMNTSSGDEWEEDNSDEEMDVVKDN